MAGAGAGDPGQRGPHQAGSQGSLPRPRHRRLAAANLSAPSGYVEDGSSTYSVRVYGLYQELDQVGNLVLSSLPAAASSG